MTKYISTFLMCFLTASCMSTSVSTETPAARKNLTSFLVNKSQVQIERILGEPTITRTEAPNQLWAYHTDKCSTLVYFDQSGQSKYVDVRGPCTQTVASR